MIDSCVYVRGHIVNAPDFERRVSEVFGITPRETRIFVKIADTLSPELRDCIKGTAVEGDVDALLVLTRLTRWQQAQLIFHLRTGLDAKLAVQATSIGLLQEMLKAFWLDGEDQNQ